ncbi:MAG TPA: alkaline phosphatase family protein, partial [Thermoanaerobaculia bacterium]|nr:alkaline phosphatase family protein [Thermoanaerobaculia bacterium]
MPASPLAPSEAPTPAAAHGESPAPAPPSAPCAAVVRPTLVGAAVGGAQGALLYGGVIALLHVRHNALGTWDALVLLGWCVLLYGAGAAVAAGTAMAALRLVRRVRGAATTATKTTAATSARDAAPAVTATGAATTTTTTSTRGAAAAGVRRDLWLASAAFHFVFWLLASSYGLTYDEAPRWVQTAWPMLGYLVLRGLVVLAATAAMAWLLLAIGGAAARRGRFVTLLATIALLLVGGQLALARSHRAAPREKPPLPATFGAKSGQRVAVVGVDGADWRVILPMVQRGELPHLARLMAEGSWGPLATFPDSNSAVIWASIYTGRGPAVHGVHDFYAIRLAGMSEATFGVYPVHRTFFKELALRLQRLDLARVQPIDRSQVEAPLIWEVASAARRSVGVVDGYYYSYPAPVLGDPRSFFLGYGSDGLWQQARKAKRAIGRDEAAVQAWPAGLLAAEGRFLTLPDFTWQGAVTLDLLSRYAQPDLLTLYSHEPDAVQHETWRFHEPSRFFGVDPATAAAHDAMARF